LKDASEKTNRPNSFWVLLDNETEPTAMDLLESEYGNSGDLRWNIPDTGAGQLNEKQFVALLHEVPIDLPLNPDTIIGWRIFVKGPESGSQNYSTWRLASVTSRISSSTDQYTVTSDQPPLSSTQVLSVENYGGGSSLHHQWFRVRWRNEHLEIEKELHKTEHEKFAITHQRRHTKEDGTKNQCGYRSVARQRTLRKTQNLTANDHNRLLNNVQHGLTDNEILNTTRAIAVTLHKHREIIAKQMCAHGPLQGSGANELSIKYNTELLRKRALLIS